MAHRWSGTTQGCGAAVRERTDRAMRGGARRPHRTDPLPVPYRDAAVPAKRGDHRQRRRRGPRRTRRPTHATLRAALRHRIGHYQRTGQKTIEFGFVFFAHKNEPGDFTAFFTDGVFLDFSVFMMIFRIFFGTAYVSLL
jgi:hypothetical protein